jgi:hypothetical protein
MSAGHFPKDTIMSFDVKKSKVLIQLLKGPIYRDSMPILWQDFLINKEQIHDYFQHIGLNVFVHDDFGFAFLRQPQNNEAIDDDKVLPRLIQQRELSFELSVLLILLRKRLAEHDNTSSEARVVLDERDIIQMMRIFLPETNNEIKQKKDIDGLVEKAIDMGIMRRMTHDQRKLEVLRILAALFDASRLAELQNRIEEYKEYAQRST